MAYSQILTFTFDFNRLGWFKVYIYIWYMIYMKVDIVDELYVRWSIPQAGWSVLAIWFCHVFCARCLGWMVLQCVVYVFKLCFPGFCLTWCPRWKILDMYLWSRLFSPSLSLSFIDSPYFDFRFGVSKNGFVLTFLSGQGTAQLGRIGLGSHPSDCLWFDLGQISLRRSMGPWVDSLRSMLCSAGRNLSRVDVGWVVRMMRIVQNHHTIITVHHRQ